MTDRKPQHDLRLVLAEIGDDPDAILAAILGALRGPAHDPSALRAIADMIDPSCNRTRFRLELKRRKGNRSQASDDWLDRIFTVGDIYTGLLQSGMSEAEANSETVKRAAMPESYGGIGKSEPTVRGYLRAFIAYSDARADELDHD
jgi:hypothetical protein